MLHVNKKTQVNEVKLDVINGCIIQSGPLQGTVVYDIKAQKILSGLEHSSLTCYEFSYILLLGIIVESVVSRMRFDHIRKGFISRLLVSKSFFDHPKCLICCFVIVGLRITWTYGNAVYVIRVWSLHLYSFQFF
jgi:hypothetical protein